ncbi:chitin disaccharide deacetylase [Bacillus sp. CGMCC 1.16607]|uniref:chitin disaccharide deacetylase n=1 Tax=Bacillus sp. CGMCC 1.16607 TaxID=3351842 RepID=UPI00362C4551
MITLIVNADDFGLSHGVNYGILDSHLYGIVNSATMMMNAPGTDHAIKLAKKYPSLKVGIHLVLTCGKPLLQDVPSLVDQNGNFNSLSTLTSRLDISLDELEREWTAQIEKFLVSGLSLTHIDSHHHVHTLEEFLPVVQKLANKYKIPVRTNGSNRMENVESFSDLCLFDFYGDGVTNDFFNKLLERIEDGKKVEVMCHPAYMDNYLLRSSSYTFNRLRELEILTTVALPEGIVLEEVIG